MTPGRRDVETEAALQRHYERLEPGPVPIGLRVAIDRIPGSVPRPARPTLARLLGPALGAAAAVSVLALAVALLGTSTPGPSSGSTPQPTAMTFDPGLQGPGLSAPASGAGRWFLVLVGVASLVAITVRFALRSRRRLAAVLPAIGAAALLAYAAYGEYAPIDVHVTGWGPRLNLTEAAMPPGATEDLYYVTAGPGEPFVFGILLIGGTSPPVRIDGIVADQPWTAVWLDDEPHGGMVAPARPFESFSLPPYGQAIYLVGRASPCALGRGPDPGENVGLFGYGPVRLNVSVLGWPRVVQVEMPRIVEPISDPCDPSLSAPTESPPSSP